MGFIHVHATNDYKQAFAFRYFLNDSEHLLPKTHRLNLVQQLKAKVLQVLNDRISLKHQQINSDKDSLYHTQVFLSSGKIIGEHQSVSQTYARKKAVKNALKFVLDAEIQTPAYQIFLAKQQRSDAQEEARQKAEKQKAHLVRMKQKQEERAIIRKQKKREAQEREIKRVLNKQSAKNKPKKERVKK